MGAAAQQAVIGMGGRILSSKYLNYARMGVENLSRS